MKKLVAAIVLLAGCNAATTSQTQTTMTADELRANFARMNGQEIYLVGIADSEPFRINPSAGLVCFVVEVDGIPCVFLDTDKPTYQAGDKVKFRGQVGSTQKGKPNLIKCKQF